MKDGGPDRHPERLPHHDHVRGSRWCLRLTPLLGRRLLEVARRGQAEEVRDAWSGFRQLKVDDSKESHEEGGAKGDQDEVLPHVRVLDPGPLHACRAAVDRVIELLELESEVAELFLRRTVADIGEGRPERSDLRV